MECVFQSRLISEIRLNSVMVRRRKMKLSVVGCVIENLEDDDEEEEAGLNS